MKKNYLHLFVIILILCCSNTVSAVNWIKKSTPFPADGRKSAASFVIGNKAYVGTGYIYKNYENIFYKDFWQYDSSTGTWTKIADFPGETRSDAMAFSSNGKGYVGLGFGSSLNHLKDFYEYNPANNTWVKIADFPDARSGAVSFTINNTGYVGTGYDTNLKSDFYKYESGRWTAIASLPAAEARDKSTAYTLDGKGYVVSGGAGPGVFGGIESIWEYDPITDTWERFGRFFPISNLLHSYVSNNLPYIVLGNDFYEYDPEYGGFSSFSTVFNDMQSLSGESFFVIHDVPYMTLGAYDFFDPKNNLDLWYDADAVANTGIKSLPAENFSVYPNPVSDYFVISGMSGAQITVTDLTGRLLLKRKSISDEEKIFASGWQQGIYVLTVNQGKNTIVRKLIIQ